MMARLLDHRQRQFLVDRIVLRHKNAQGGVAAARARPLDKGWLGRFGYRFAQRQRQGEGRALPELAFGAQRTVHQTCQLGADRQAKPGSAESPRRRVVGLGEFLENPFEAIGRNSDTGVAYRDEDPIVLIGTAPTDRHIDRDLALFGELHRIAQKVQHDLPDPHLVHEHGDRQRRIDFQTERKVSSPRHGLHQAQATLQFLAQIGRLADDRHLLGFDLREIEQVVQQLQHRIAGIGDHLEATLLLGVLLFAQGQFGEADDSVHRGADFMAHVGQEIGLRIVGRARFFEGLGEPLAHQRFVGPVDDDAQNRRRLTIGAGFGSPPDFDVTHLLIGTDQASLEAIGLRRGDRLFDRVLNDGAVFRVEEVDGRFQFGCVAGRQTMQAENLVGPIHLVPIEVETPVADMCRSLGHLEHLVALGQFGGRFLDLAHDMAFASEEGRQQQAEKHGDQQAARQDQSRRAGLGSPFECRQAGPAQREGLAGKLHRTLKCKFGAGVRRAGRDQEIVRAGLVAIEELQIEFFSLPRRQVGQ